MTPKPYTLVSAGEDKEMLKHPGVPFKGQGEKVAHDHTNFINRVRLSPDASKFVTVSSDKLVGMFDAKTFEAT